MLNAYCEERAQPGPPLAKTFHFTRQQVGVVKNKERAFNPLTQTHIDQAKEKGVCVSEADRMIRDINAGMKKALTTTSYVGYDIVNQAPRFGLAGVDKLGTEHVEKGKRTSGVRPAESNVSYDIVTLQPAEGNPPPPQGGPHHSQRQYNIVSHLYRESHTERLHDKDVTVRDAYAARKLREYDPLLARHNNPAEEAAYADERAAAMAAKRAELHATTTRTPAAVRRSEGHNYDIIKGTAHSAQGVRTLEQKTMAGVPSRRRARARAAALVEATDARTAHEAQMSLNKVAHQRHVDRCRTGYDIVTGQPTTTLPPLPGKGAADQETSWALLTKSGSVAVA